MTDAMIQGFMRKINRSRISRPRIVICIPSGITSVEQRSIREAAEHANASEVFLIEEPMAAAIGIGIDVSLPIGNMIVEDEINYTKYVIYFEPGVTSKSIKLIKSYVIKILAGNEVVFSKVEGLKDKNEKYLVISIAKSNPKAISIKVV